MGRMVMVISGCDFSYGPGVEDGGLLLTLNFAVG
jgi:hypothetical protein